MPDSVLIDIDPGVLGTLVVAAQEGNRHWNSPSTREAIRIALVLLEQSYEQEPDVQRQRPLALPLIRRPFDPTDQDPT